MSEDKTPQRPDGMDGAPTPQASGAPRVAVEPTPVPPEGAGATAQIPHDTAAGATAPGATSATGTASAAPTETITRTVVKTKTKKLPVFITALAGFAVGAVFVIALVMTGAFHIDNADVAPAASSSSQTQHIKIDPEDTTLAETVAAKALPSVVSITAVSADGNSGSIGSGVILDANGNILTNNHVVDGASDITVAIDGGQSFEAEAVGADDSSDLAVIRLKDTKGAKLTPIEIGDSDKLTVGEWVMAIGSPFGNEQSVSTGIVSALYRSTALPSSTGTSIYANMIQTDAAINPGNSGGALVNDQGQLIGINSVIESNSGSSAGVGFAIPINYAKHIAQQIIDGKTPEHAYLGVTLTSVTARSARRNNLAVSEGALVVSVEDGGPAAQAGVKQDDIITKVDDTDITSADSAIIAIRSHDVGDTVTLTVMRGGEEKKLEVKLGSDEKLQKEQAQQGGDTTEGNSSGNGMSREQLYEYLQNLLGGGQGMDGQGMGGQGMGGMY